MVLLESHWRTSGIHPFSSVTKGNYTKFYLEYMGIAGIILQWARGLYSTGVPDRSDSGECLVVSVTG